LNEKKSNKCDICGSENLEILKVSRGTHENKSIVFPGIYKYEELGKEVQYKSELEFEESKKEWLSISRGISTAELLVDVDLIIHIIPEDQNLLEHIKNSFLSPVEYPSLGRREDIAVIEEVKEVEVIEKELSEDTGLLTKDWTAYIPLKYIEDESVVIAGRHEVINKGTRYKLAKNYELINYGTKKAPKIFRKWKKVDVLFSSGVQAVEDEIVTLDTDNNLIFAI
ncbi:MAG: hypothetical protein LBV03_00240, partial [Fusobacteriales bacterium]|nr:hypothetical protein [Fusobacteriales bacterium]